MAKGHKTGARTAGTPNRKTQEVSELLESLGCDPVEGMARIATNEKHSPELRGRMFAELAQYVYPKRKAVELAADPVPPPQSKLVVEFVRARPTAVEETATNEHTVQSPGWRAGYKD
jgi:hypothetical protein